MKEPPNEHIGRLLDTLVARPGVAPGAVGGVTFWHKREWQTYTGVAGNLDPFGPSLVTTDSVYDLASLTKPLVAFSFARAVDAGLLDWQDRVSHWLPYCRDSQLASATLVSLLAHRSGLSAHLEVFAPLRNGEPFRRDRALAQLASALSPQRVPLASSIGTHRAVYSDLGYILIGEVLQRATHMALDQWVVAQLEASGATQIFSAAQFAEYRVPVQRVAATELVAYRSGLVRGLVHDDNAWALGGSGCCGHAGLFGTIGGVLDFARLMLEIYGSNSAALSPHSAQMLLSVRPDSSLRVGFDGKSSGPSSVGEALGSHTFGHLGFTGTSFWCDPEQNIAVALLSNRVCPSRENKSIRAVRPLVHDALARLAIDQRQSNSHL